MRAYLICAPIAFVALLAGATLACSGSDTPTTPSDSNSAPGSLPELARQHGRLTR